MEGIGKNICVAVLIKRDDTAREHCLGRASSPSLPVWLVSADKAKGGGGVGSDGEEALIRGVPPI